MNVTMKQITYLHVALKKKQLIFTLNKNRFALDISTAYLHKFL